MNRLAGASVGGLVQCKAVNMIYEVGCCDRVVGLDWIK